MWANKRTTTKKSSCALGSTVLVAAAHVKVLRNARGTNECDIKKIYL